MSGPFDEDVDGFPFDVPLLLKADAEDTLLFPTVLVVEERLGDAELATADVLLGPVIGRRRVPPPALLRCVPDLALE